MKLVIVESPAKCKTIGKYLGADYKVMASYGHIRDLSTHGKGGLGVDMENNFAPSYVNDKAKTKVINELKKEAKKADEVILATDPDREGEAIAWHLAIVLDLPVETTKRLEFHEITKPAIDAAILNPRTINMDLVESQECRRILDRIVGFKLTGLLKKKIRMESAGRVQSATLKLIIDHEKEVDAFVPEDYWTIDGQAYNELSSFGIKYDGKVGGKADILSEQDGLDLMAQIPGSVNVTEVRKANKKRESKPPFTTSTMQQEAFNKYKYSTKKTATLAQSLYEGKAIGNETVGLITYMRTDSTRLSPQFIGDAKTYISQTYGDKYISTSGPRVKKGQIQDAHEGIRPTSILRTPASIKDYLTRDEFNLYKLIYNRAIASLMAASEYQTTIIKLEGNGLTFRAEGEVTLFDGYFAAYKDTESEEEEEKAHNVLPTIEEGHVYKTKDMKLDKHTTMPPSHYSEGKVVKLMEELGIGRPSTYASTISLLLKRQYVKSESHVLIPTNAGKLTIDYLDAFFIRVINTNFTAEMEETLDKVMTKKDTRIHILTTFCNFFMPLIERAETSEYKIPDQYIESMGVCPQCGSMLVKKRGTYGTFIACSNYPQCNYIEKKKKEPAVPTGELCPKCGSPMVFRKNKRGETFEACSNFPKCKYIKNNEEQDAPVVVGKCPDCGGDLIVKKGVHGRSSFIGCSNYPRCHHIEKYTGSK